MVTINVTDSGSPAQTASVQLQLNVISTTGGTFTISNVSVGKNLQTLITVSIAQPAPTSGQPLTLTSPDGSRVVMNGQSGPSSQITTSIAGGTTSVSLNVQALQDNGTVTLIASAPNFTSLGGVVTLTPSGFVLSAGATSRRQFQRKPGQQYDSDGSLRAVGYEWQFRGVRAGPDRLLYSRTADEYQFNGR